MKIQYEQFLFEGTQAEWEGSGLKDLFSSIAELQYIREVEDALSEGEEHEEVTV